MTDTQILIRLFNDYTKKYVPKIFLALIFTLIFGLTTEMMIQSNVINPLALILLYISCSKKITL